jgi:hypothetical protein
VLKLTSEGKARQVKKYSSVNNRSSW